MQYFISYNTGIADEEVTGTLNDAKRIAEEGLSYTQKKVEIYNEEKETVSVAEWHEYTPSEDDDVLCKFGTFGFYSEWLDV